MAPELGGFTMMIGLFTTAPFSGHRGKAWASVLAAMVGACGSEAAIVNGGSGGATSSTTTAGGHTGDGGGAGGLLGFGGMSPDPCESSMATIEVDGEPSPVAKLETLWFAPGTFAEICFAHEPEDLPVCNSTLYLSLGGFEMGENPATGTATFADEPPLESEPDGFVFTITDLGPPTVATFEGTVGTGAEALTITGSLSGCAQATE